MDRVLQRVSRGFAVALCIASVLVLLGWQLRIPVLKGSVFGSFIAPNTALCFIVCVASLLLQLSESRKLITVGRVLGFFVLLAGLLTLIEWLFHIDFGIDRLFFAHRLEDWYLPVPGRFAMNSCFGFMAAGMALLNVRRRPLIAEVCSALLLLLTYLSIIGYMYSATALYASGNVMALPTAFLFGLLGVALLCSGSGQFLEIVLSPYAGGIVSRRIISSIVILMPLFGLLEIKSRSEDLISREFGIALLVIVAVVVFTSQSLRTAMVLNRIDRQRLETEAALRVSQQKQAESIEEVKLNLKRLELIEGAVNVGTWEFDPATGISAWPPGISALWGLPPTKHEVTLQQFVSRIHSDDRERVTNLIQAVLRTGEFYDVEFRVIWPDQSVHWLGARGAVIRDDSGKPVRVIGIALDVTDRHQTERALRESEKLAATGRLAATIAHEINNPLEAVVNLVFLARHDPTVSTTVRGYLEDADVELARVGHMVRQTLGFYRESSHPVWIDVAGMIEQLVRLYRNKMQRKSIKLDLQVQPARIHGLEGELRQVISNLISNAIDAVSLDGRIVVRVRNYQGKVRIIVADDGHGVSSENRGKIFQAFFTTKKDVGTGLGLWVSKGIIEKHHGRIRLRTSTRDGASGTVFILDFPSEPMKLAQTASL